MQWRDVCESPSTSKLRWFGILLGVMLLFFAWRCSASESRMMYFSSRQLAIALSMLSVSVVAAAVVRPTLLSSIYRAWMVAVFPIAFVVNWLLWLLLFALVVMPLALLLRFAGRDRLRLRPLAPGSSLWRTLPEKRTARHFWRQY